MTAVRRHQSARYPLSLVLEQSSADVWHLTITLETYCSSVVVLIDVVVVVLIDVVVLL